MSMPNILDITLDTNITIEKAIGLLLASIAMEEASLSKLLDAESQRVKYSLQCHSPKENYIKDMLSINSSVNSTIVNINKMQMLLQWKLEHISRLIPGPPSSHPPSKPYPPKRPCPPVNKPYPNIKGKVICYIQSEYVEFAYARVILCTNVSSSKCKDNYLNYRVIGENIQLLMQAYPCSIYIQSPLKTDHRKIIISGRGKAEKIYKHYPTIQHDISFELTIWDKPRGKKGFCMLIFCHDVALTHDSGFVKIENYHNKLNITMT